MRTRAVRTLVALGIGAVAATSPTRAPAGEPAGGEPRGEARVPLSENFSRLELAGLGALAAGDALLYAFADPLAEWRGEPLLGDAWAWDRRVSDELWPGPGARRFLWGVPDFTGVVGAPLAAGGFYAVDALALGLRGRALSGDPNADHEVFAFVEAYGLSIGLVQVVKLSIGRERPLYALGRPGAPPLESDPDGTLSFYSGHTSTSFTIASFVWRDVSDWLVRERLGESGAARRLWIGRVLPGALFYGGAGVVGLSRVIDQKHYLTDALAGAVMGVAVGNLTYALHFDGRGRPRRRARRGDAPAARVSVAPFPGGLGVRGSF